MLARTFVTPLSPAPPSVSGRLLRVLGVLVLHDGSHDLADRRADNAEH